MADKSRRSALYFLGLRQGIAVALGYLSVSFGFGILAEANGLSLPLTILISMTNLTSAGQVGGVSILCAGGSLIEMALTQLVINLRYSLMSLTLSQRLHPTFSTGHRLICSFAITDEIFALAAAHPHPLRPAYFYGLMTLPWISWVLGTLLGGAMGGLLPHDLRDALGIAIYGMFLAIVLPVAKKERGVLTAALIACLISLLIAYLPIFSFVSSGFSVIVCALIASLIAAALFPTPDERREEET